MKALICPRHGAPGVLTIDERPTPVAEPNQIVVRVHAAGINFPDVLMIAGKYQFSPPLPFIPGKELAGVVIRVGTDVQGFKVGDRVCAQVSNGAFAQEAAVVVNFAVGRLPDSIDFTMGAAFPLAYTTGMHALTRGQLRRGETLLVLGAAGGVGLAAVQLGKLFGARVIACASSDEKLALCRAHGADETINYEREDLREAIKRITGGRGVDVAIDPVGGRYAEPVVRSMAWNGRYCVVGFAAGEIPKIALNLILLKGCALLGVAVASNARHDATEYGANFARLVDWIAAGDLKPVVTATYPMERTAQAILDSAERRIQGKAVVIFD
jgi:NADPH2:quinone reductase